MNQPLLTIENLCKEFVLHILKGKHVLAFRDISFEVPERSFIGIAGRSGSGKSSLLKCIFRTYLSDSGSITYTRPDESTIDLTTASDDEMLDVRQRDIGYVSQFLRPVPRVTAIDLAARPLIRQGVSKEEAQERIAYYFNRLQLPEELWDGYPILFSGGEQQRVNLARALAAQPRLLLLDEPTSALDGTLQQEVVRLFEEARSAGVTMIGVMHDTELLEQLSDRVLTMQDGSIVDEHSRDGVLAEVQA